MKGLVSVLLSAVMLAGCASKARDVNLSLFNYKIQPYPTVVTETTKYNRTSEYVISTNYKIQEVKKSNIGSPMIKVKDNITSFEESDTVIETVEDKVDETIIPTFDKPNSDFKPSLIVSSDFELVGLFQKRTNGAIENLSFKYNANSVFNILGTLLIDSLEYYVIEMDKSKYNFLVTKQGYFVTNKILENDGDHYHLYNAELKITPSEINFNLKMPEQLSQKHKETRRQEKKNRKTSLVDHNRFGIPVINYELIYGGKDTTGLHIVYREYTGDEIARQAFYQNLNYENKAKTIRFKNTNIEVISADNERITFKVLEDDIFDLENKGKMKLPKNITNETVTKK
jgi:hypothetical protein